MRGSRETGWPEPSSSRRMARFFCPELPFFFCPRRFLDCAEPPSASSSCASFSSSSISLMRFSASPIQ